MKTGRRSAARGLGAAFAAAAVFALAACSTAQLLEVATSSNPRAAAEQVAQAQARYYATHPKQFVRDFHRLVATLRGHAGRQWGRREAITPSRRRYVKYTQNYMSRAVVDFDAGTVTVETLDAAHPQTSLRSAIVTTLLTPEDPAAVDLYSDKPVRLSGTPYLYGLVTDRSGRPIGTPQAAADYADYLVAHAATRTVSTPGGRRLDHYVHIAMVPDHTGVQARKYRPLVTRYAKRYGVSTSLVYAIIKVESDFNPYAVSSDGAYGLMQLIPTQAGADAYRAVHGRALVPGRDYLMDPGNNIELGSAYLNILGGRYLAGIANPVSLEYCTIAAYNAGSGTVLGLFSPRRSTAVARINRERPPSVYRSLESARAPAEMRRYLLKVLAARRSFVAE